MKLNRFAMLLALALVATACDENTPAPEASPTNTARGDECPRADGNPCR